MALGSLFRGRMDMRRLGQIKPDGTILSSVTTYVNVLFLYIVWRVYDGTSVIQATISHFDPVCM
jgi:hypothetical protein